MARPMVKAMASVLELRPKQSPMVTPKARTASARGSIRRVTQDRASSGKQ